MAGSLTDIFAAMQNGVVALGNLKKQMLGSFNNINSQLALATRINVVFNARTMTDASGSVAYTGVGFRPSWIVSFGIFNATDGFFIGQDNGQGVTANSPRAYIRAAGTWQTTGVSGIYLTTNFADIQEAHVTSMDADGFTLAWTKTGAPAAGTGFFTVLAFK